MTSYACIEAQLLWALLFSRGDGRLNEAGADYAGLLEGMDAAQLMALVEQAKLRLAEMTVEKAAVDLFVDKYYHIHLGSPEGTDLPFRPLVRALFILFLKHPEGILLKDRERFRSELETIYGVVAPNISIEDRQRRVQRLTDLQDNAFSENLSVLNATLDRLLPSAEADEYKIQGDNGNPRRIPLSPLKVHWEAGQPLRQR